MSSLTFFTPMADSGFSTFFTWSRTFSFSVGLQRAAQTENGTVGNPQQGCQLQQSTWPLNLLHHLSEWWPPRLWLNTSSGQRTATAGQPYLPSAPGKPAALCTPTAIRPPRPPPCTPLTPGPARPPYQMLPIWLFLNSFIPFNLFFP